MLILLTLFYGWSCDRVSCIDGKSRRELPLLYEAICLPLNPGECEFIFYGRGGEIATNRLEDQEVAMLALHLLQISLVYINTLMMQQIFTDDVWFERMTPEDFRALTPLTYAHINPYGKFELDMQQRLHLEAA